MIIEALQEAAFFRDARSNVVRSAARRRGREPESGDQHREMARAYQELAVRLKSHVSSAAKNPSRSSRKTE
jgi:hypothetical protein